MERFTVGQENANFLISCGILSKAWEEARLANNSESYTLNECEGVAYVAFPSFQRIEDFILNESQCGEGNILTDHKFFSGCLKGYDDKPAFIHPGALTLFLHIMEETDFQAKLHIYTDSEQTKLKPIIFVGHSIGGAVATLATLWVLGKRVRQSSPFCITFGCPLVGDERLVEAVDRENWGCKFCHVVSRHDIVPRMLLAPIESIAKPFTTIFRYWQGINVPDSSIQDACRTLLNHVFDSPSSQYRPFGTYMLCSRNGAACIENAQTVLEMLRLTMQSQQGSFDEIVEACLSEHIRYNSVLEELMQTSIGGIRIAISDSEESSYEMGISSQLEAIGVGARDDLGQLALRRGEVRNAYDQIDDSHIRIELSQKKATLAELEWYKEVCEKNEGITYYDSFKNQNDRKGLEADSRRLKLAEFWDEIVEMWESHELPSDLETQNKWINAGTTYRRLVEPLDIAFYYSKGKGNYLSDGRPRRHKVLQEWIEAKEKTRSSRVQGRRTKPASLTRDSCFWAHVEEALKDLKSVKQGQHQKIQNLENFEEYVTKMGSDLSISSDVFFEGSSFMMWWEEWKEYNKSQSPDWSSSLSKMMESENPFKFEGIDSLTVAQGASLSRLENCTDMGPVNVGGSQSLTAPMLVPGGSQSWTAAMSVPFPNIWGICNRLKRRIKGICYRCKLRVENRIEEICSLCMITTIPSPSRPLMRMEMEMDLPVVTTRPASAMYVADAEMEMDAPVIMQNSACCDEEFNCWAGEYFCHRGGKGHYSFQQGGKGQYSFQQGAPNAGNGADLEK